MKTFGKQFWIIFGLFLLFIVIILFFPYWFTQFNIVSFDFEQTGSIGDTIGGILGPFVAIGGAILTFFAFWVQYQANEQQKLDLKIERFENKFYQLIQIHRDNVSEIIIRERIGRKGFISMFNELKFTYLAVTEYYKNQWLPGNEEQLSDEVLYNIAYLIFYHGKGKTASKIVTGILQNKHKEFVKQLLAYLEGQANKMDIGMLVEIRDKDIQFAHKLHFIPFRGHTSRLSHYYRHIDELLKFVDKNYPEELNYEARFNYISTLRAQLSVYEQLLIYYHSISIMGSEWLKKDSNDESLLIKYSLIQTLPLAVADFYKNPEELFGRGNKNKNGKDIFEWPDLLSKLS